MGRPRKYQTDEERKAARREYSKRWREQNAEYFKKWKEQNAERIKQYYQNNAERYKQYYQDNADSIKERKKQYYQDNADIIKEYSKQYYQDNAEYYKQHSKQYYQNTKIGRANSLIASYRENDKKYNRGECTLTSEWIVKKIFSNSCHYCGESNWKRLGCDRIDNTKPHTQDNVVPCCSSCNRKRGKKDYNMFVNEIKYKGYNQM